MTNTLLTNARMTLAHAPGTADRITLGAPADDGVSFADDGVIPGNSITYTIYFGSAWESGKTVYHEQEGQSFFDRTNVQASSNGNSKIDITDTSAVVVATSIVDSPPTFPSALQIDADPTMAANSDNRLPTQKAVRGYVAAYGGTGGGSGATFEFHQVSPSTEWDITHNLSKFPSVVVVDSAGDGPVMGEVEYTDSDHLKLFFSAGFAGVAYLN